MTRFRRGMTVLALVATLVAAGFTIAHFNREPARSDERPTLATNGSGPTGSTGATAKPDDNRPGGNEDVHTDKPGESK